MHKVLYVVMFMGACGLVGKAMGPRTKGLGYDSHCWSSAEIIGTLLSSYCLWLPNNNGCLVDQRKLN